HRGPAPLVARGPGRPRELQVARRARRRRPRARGGLPGPRERRARCGHPALVLVGRSVSRPASARTRPSRPAVAPAEAARLTSLAGVERAVIACERCARLRAWCERVAHEKKRAFRDQEYWGRPVPGFGDPAARLLVVGLAPAAHGGNRTGRVFTGDSSGS